MSGAKKKTYVIVIGLGVGGLLVDRLIRSGGPTAPAPAAAAPNPNPPLGGAPSPAGPEVLLTVPRFPQQLPDPATTFSQRDPFAPSAAVTLALRPPDTAETEELDPSSPGGHRGPTSEEFVGRHRLSAAIRVENCWLAVVDGMVLSPGQVFDNCRLIEVRDRSAHFQCRDGEAELALDNPFELARPN